MMPSDAPAKVPRDALVMPSQAWVFKIISQSFHTLFARFALQELWTITTPQFKQRAAQILNSYGVAAPGQTHSFLQKLVRGMPKRLAKCKANKYGRCGK